MSFIHKLSIRTKITLVIISVSLFAIIVGFTIIAILNINNFKKNLINQGFLIGRLVGEYSEYALIFDDPKVANENLRNLKTVPSIINAELYTASGDFYTSYKDTIPTFKNLVVTRASSKFEKNRLLIYEPIYSSDKELIGSLLLTISQADLNKNVNNNIKWMLIIIFFVTIVIVLLARTFQKIISYPILKLADLTLHISETNDYTVRIENKSDDEIGILFEGFNNMLEEIVRNQKAMQKAQDELRDSQEQFSTFMEMLPAAAFIKNQDSTFFYVNKFLAGKFDAENWIGKKFESELPSNKKHFNSLHDNEALFSVKHHEEYLYDKNNELRYFELWKFPIYRKEKPTLIGGIAIDVTIRKLTETKVNYYIKELERNNKELEEFNYVASHDLREPLRTITSYCDLLSEDIGYSLNETVKEDIRFITDATTRMNVLIQDLLQLSRAGRIEFESKPIDLNDVIYKVMLDLSLKIKETNSTINVKKMPIILGDAVQLGRVFQNLLTNAIKFKSEQDPVINIDANNMDNFTEIVVSDNGIGIDKQYHQQIFAPFKRLHSRDKYEGTGIGLAICKKIIERHNGNIYIESEPGKGSKFKLIFRKLET